MFTTQKVFLAVFINEKYFEQEVFSKFCVSLAIIENAISEGRKVIQKLPHARRPFNTVNDDDIKKVKETVLENRRVSIRELAADFNICYGSTQHILVNVLGMKCVNARLLPKKLDYFTKTMSTSSKGLKRDRTPLHHAHYYSCRGEGL